MYGFMQTRPIFRLLLALSLPVASAPAAEPETVVIDSLAALADYAGRSHVRVKMKAGVYLLNDASLARAAALIEANLVDDVFIFRGAKPFGREGLPALDAMSRQRLADPKRFRAVDPVQLGQDQLVQYERII